MLKLTLSNLRGEVFIFFCLRVSKSTLLNTVEIPQVSRQTSTSAVNRGAQTR